MRITVRLFAALRETAGWSQRELELPEAWRVNPDDTLIERLREWLAPENVQVVY